MRGDGLCGVVLMLDQVPAQGGKATTRQDRGGEWLIRGWGVSESMFGQALEGVCVRVEASKKGQS